MQLATYVTPDDRRAGVVVDGLLFDAGQIATALGLPDPSSLSTTKAILEAGPAVWAALGAAAAASSQGTPVSEVLLGPPVEDPDKIICLGLNYRDHAREANLPAPDVPMIFAKFRNSLVGPTDEIVLPPVSSAVDYEAELAVVMGRRAKDVSAAHALDYVAGVTVLNDVSARDVQLATSQWGAGKAIDTFAPCGPTLVLLDEIDDIQGLAVKTRLNGKLVQDGNTRDMIFTVARTIEFLSGLMTLEPGDIIATGTPAGVGMSRNPPVVLRDGDVLETEIESIGVLRNPVHAAAARPGDGAPQPAHVG